MALPLPVIVVPGITASNLRDEYPVSPETVWSVLTKDYTRISLHPDNTLYEVIEPARVRPDNLMSVAYHELVEELKYNLRSKEDEPVPVYPFAYDWRLPLHIVEDQLAVFIKEVIERTKLMRHYAKDNFRENPKVNLVGHSMGGLIITCYLEKYKLNSSVSKVATLATPFKGSYEAVIKITTGTANLGVSSPSSRERESARVTPALYHLIPTCGGLTLDASLPQTDLFDTAVWQQSITQTIEEYVRLYAVDTANTQTKARELFTGLLNEAKNHRTRISNFKLLDAGLKNNDWLAVAGANSVTRVRLKIVSTSHGPDFEFYSNDRDDKWKDGTNTAEKMQTGDGTVPFEAALPNFLGIENIVCVTPEDFGYWELEDRTLSSIAGFHGILPNMNMIHRLIVRHFTGSESMYNNTWGRIPPGVSKDKWQPPMKLRDKE